MHLRGPQAISLFILLLFLSLGWLLWQWRPEAGTAESAALPTLVPTAPPVALATVAATATAVATVTPALTVAPPATATPVPAATAVPTTATTVTASATATATAEATASSPVVVDRACPDPVPTRPTYSRFHLAGVAYATPDASLARAHFWLSRPVAGNGPLAVNQSYPYGSDGNGRYLLHNGLDFGEAAGTPVLAVADGVVVVAQSDANELYGWRCDWYGQLVVLQLDETWLGQPVYVLYGHVLEIHVEMGQRVQRGQPLAQVGRGGAAVVPHLHLEVRVGSNAFSSTRNPALWLEPGDGHGVIAGRLVDAGGRPWQGLTLTLIDLGSGELANTWSYLDDSLGTANPDEGWAENFVFAPVAAGNYHVYVKLQEIDYRLPVEVIAGEVSVLEIVTSQE